MDECTVCGKETDNKCDVCNKPCCDEHCVSGTVEDKKVWGHEACVRIAWLESLPD